MLNPSIVESFAFQEYEVKSNTYRGTLIDDVDADAAADNDEDDDDENDEDPLLKKRPTSTMAQVFERKV